MQSRRATVLVVDDEEDDLTKTRELLTKFRMVVRTAKSTAEALQEVGSVNIDLAVIDWRLKGQDDGIVLGRVLLRNHGIPFVLVSNYLDSEIAGVAYKLGAADVVAKHLGPDRVLAAVNLGLRRPSVPASHVTDLILVECGSDSAPECWAEIVLTACRAEKDPNTESAIAKANNKSTSAYHRVCKSCDVSGNGTCDLARFLRALTRSIGNGSMLRDHLVPMDPRTRSALFQKAGLPTDSRFVPLRRFLLNQKFIPTDKTCFRELAHQVANSPIFFGGFDPDDPDDPKTDLK